MTNVIVIGLGAMGSSAAQQLAERGHRVLGFDLFTPPHNNGSSHGQTRIIRQAYWEDWRYVPLLLRSYELWRRLGADSGHSLLQITGCLAIGHPDGDLISRSEQSARKFELPHEMLSSAQIRHRYPAFAVRDEMVGHWEKNAGYLLVEACVRAQLERAAVAGAELHCDEPVVEWSATPGGGVSVRTAKAHYSADRLVICAGAWAAQVLDSLQLPLTVTRQVAYWFEPRCGIDIFQHGRMPVYLWEAEAGERMLYGFPLVGPPSEGVKVALHGSDEICTPDTVVRQIQPSDELAIRERLAGTLPLLAGRLLRAETCLYTMTPDEHFVIDSHPEYPQVTLAAGFSGHGFKFASVMGEVLGDLALGLTPAYDLALFSLQRLQDRSPS